MSILIACLLLVCVEGLIVPFTGGGNLVIEVASATTFRLGVRFDSWGSESLPSPSVSSSLLPAPSQAVSWGIYSGYTASFGSLVAATDGSGAWALYDSSNNSLVGSTSAPYMNNASGVTKDAGIVLPVSGASAAEGPSRPCLGNGIFGPPFYYNRAGSYMSFAVSESSYDGDFPHCYPVSFSGSLGQSERTGDACAAGGLHNGSDVTGAVRSSDFPEGIANVSQAQCCAACDSDASCTSWIYSLDGPDSSGKECWPLSSYAAFSPNPNRLFGGIPPVTAWWGMGPAVDWYLAPSPTPLSFTRAFYDLTGAPAMPPRHAFGFMYTYWGYGTMEEVEGNMTKFRDGEFPADTSIMDYDWFLNNNAQIDFGYDSIMFGPHNFTHPPNSTVPNASTTDAPSLFAHFTNDIHMRWMGIRKPRAYDPADIVFSNASNWLLPESWNVGAGGNNWNYSKPDMQEWYYANHTHFLNDGVEGWWNDEGETQWFTYTYWNLAEAMEYKQARPNQRFFTINRSFQPGMQQHPAISWTGDRQSCDHLTVLSFTVAGQLFTACDMTAPDATILVRQYWNAVFLPIMRVHAMHGTPRFPWYWGGEDAQDGFRAALNTRYHFIPYLYSLAYMAHTTGAPIALPASYHYPNSSDFPPTTGDAVYMVGDALLPADVCTSNNFDPNENVTRSTLPPGLWYAYNSTATLTGPLFDLTYTDVPLDKLVLFVRAGAILTLQRDVIQYSDLLGGALEVHIYAGSDGSFTMTEDDGTTNDYLTESPAALRQTTFAWSDATKTLSWTIAGTYAGGPNLFTEIFPILFVSNASAPVTHASAPLGIAGSISF